MIPFGHTAALSNRCLSHLAMSRARRRVNASAMTPLGGVGLWGEAMTFLLKLDIGYTVLKLEELRDFFFLAIKCP